MMKNDLIWFKTRTVSEKKEVFDPIRKKYVKLTPEEEIRQITLHYLVEQAAVPPGIIAVEYAIRMHKMAKRCDIVVFSPALTPLMIVECKAGHIAVSQKVVEQASAYNLKLKVRFLLITNGQKHYCYKVDFDTRSTHFMDHIPTYEEMIGERNNESDHGALS